MKIVAVSAPRSPASNDLIGPLAHLGLARAYALEACVGPDLRPGQAGQSPPAHPAALTKAGTAYQDFLGLGNDADPDIPLLQQATSEYAKLHRSLSDFRGKRRLLARRL